MYIVFTHKYEDYDGNTAKSHFVQTPEGAGAIVASELAGKTREFAVKIGESALKVSSLGEAGALFRSAAEQMGSFSGLAYNEYTSAIFAVSPVPAAKFPIIAVVLSDNKTHEVRVAFFREYKDPYFSTKTIKSVAEYVFRTMGAEKVYAHIPGDDEYIFNAGVDGLRNYMQGLYNDKCLFGTEITVSDSSQAGHYLTLYLVRVPSP